MNPLFKLTYGLHILSVAHENESNGCVINTAIQVTAEPAMLSVTVSKNNHTTKQIQEKQSFTVCPLLEQASMNTIALFGFESGKNVNKFEKIPCQYDLFSNPYLTKEVAARFSCKVVKEIDLGTHMMFIGELTESETLNETDAVMTYDYYQTVKKGTTPKNAPSYKKETAQAGYKCKICGYVTDTLPADFICPICKKPAEFFEKL